MEGCRNGGGKGREIKMGKEMEMERKMEVGRKTEMGRKMVRRGSVGSASACCKAGPSSFLGSAPQGGFSH